jgi:GNAT superfamily N-acetyltransferase
MDMLIKLYDLPSVEPCLGQLAHQGIAVRQAMAYERLAVVQWVEQTFNAGWAAESATAFAGGPAACFIAVQAHKVCGFCCWNTTFRNFIGPVGVSRPFRNKGVGRGLVLAALHAMRHSGNAYAVAGDVGAPEFFKAVAGALEIPDSTPGPYPARLGK